MDSPGSNNSWKKEKFKLLHQITQLRREVEVQTQKADDEATQKREKDRQLADMEYEKFKLIKDLENIKCNLPEKVNYKLSKEYRNKKIKTTE